MPVAFNAQCHAMMQDTAEKRVCGSSEQLHLSKGQVPKVAEDGRGSGTSHKMVVNGKADCYILLKFRNPVSPHSP